MTSGSGLSARPLRSPRSGLLLLAAAAAVAVVAGGISLAVADHDTDVAPYSSEYLRNIRHLEAGGARTTVEPRSHGWSPGERVELHHECDSLVTVHAGSHVATVTADSSGEARFSFDATPGSEAGYCPLIVIGLTDHQSRTAPLYVQSATHSSETDPGGGGTVGGGSPGGGGTVGGGTPGGGPAGAGGGPANPSAAQGSTEREVTMTVKMSQAAIDGAYYVYGYDHRNPNSFRPRADNTMQAIYQVCTLSWDQCQMYLQRANYGYRANRFDPHLVWVHGAASTMVFYNDWIVQGRQYEVRARYQMYDFRPDNKDFYQSDWDTVFVTHNGDPVVVSPTDWPTHP